MNEKAEYLKNELRSYNMMKRFIEKDYCIFDDQIQFCEKKIREIDIELSSGNSKGIDYDYVPTSAVREPLLVMLAEQEKYIKRRDELIELKQKDIYAFKERIKYIEDCLNKLEEEWQRRFIKDIYCDGKTIDDILGIYPYERSRLYELKDIFLNKMSI